MDSRRLAPRPPAPRVNLSPPGQRRSARDASVSTGEPERLPVDERGARSAPLGRPLARGAGDFRRVLHSMRTGFRAVERSALECQDCGLKALAPAFESPWRYLMRPL